MSRNARRVQRHRGAEAVKSPAGAANSIARSANREHATKESESKMNGKRTGFTLVELIVVMMIVGILSGSVMLLVGNTDDRDEATRTIANLRQLKSAALMYYADNHMHTGDTTLPAGNQIANLDLYMTRTLDGSYWFGVISDDWYVYRDLAGLGSGVRTRLADLSARDEEKELEGGNDSGVVLRVPFNTGHSQLRLFVLEGGTGSIGGGGGSDDDEENDALSGAVQWREGVGYHRGALVWRDVEINGEIERRYYVHVVPSNPGQDSNHTPNKEAFPEDNSDHWVQWSTPIEWTSGNSPAKTIVTYKGQIYVAFHQGNQAPDVSSGTKTWKKITNNWESDGVYHKTVQLFHEGSLFEAREHIPAGQGAPGTIGVAWQELTNEWRPHNVYKTGEQVFFEGKLYQAISDSGPGATDPSSASIFWVLK